MREPGESLGGGDGRRRGRGAQREKQVQETLPGDNPKHFCIVPDMRILDWCVLAFVVYEAILLASSQYPANGASAFEAVAVAALTYFSLRALVHTTKLASWLCGLVAIAGIWLGTSGIREFANGIEPLSAVGLTNFVAFRSRLIHPILGWVPGETFTVFLLFLPFACAAAVYNWHRRNYPIATLALVAATFVVAVLTLSLSRAVFWSTGLFFLITCALLVGYRAVTLRTGSLVIAGALGSMLLIMACEAALYPGIFTAYAGRHTSQIRSTQGRIGIWERSLEIVRQHPWCGVGSSNAALFLLSTSDQDETIGFASKAFSLPIQVLVEKGVIGCGLYVSFLILIGYEFHRSMRSQRVTGTSASSPTCAKIRGSAKRNQKELSRHNEVAHKAMKCCYAAGLLAVLFREITYSSLLEHTATLTLAYMLAALGCGEVRAS